MVGVDKYVGLSDVTPIRRVLDYELSAGAMCKEEERDHAVDDVVGSLELGSMFGWHKTCALDVVARPHDRWSTVGGGCGLEESRDGEGTTRRCGEDDCEFAADNPLAQRVVHVFICDVRLVASARLGVVVHEFDFETELPKELGEAVGTIVISGKEEEDLDGHVHSTLGGLRGACESLGQ